MKVYAEMPLTQLRKAFNGREIYIRCKDARFKITRTAFERTMRALNHVPVFCVEIDDKKVLIEGVNQLLHSGGKPTGN